MKKAFFLMILFIAVIALPAWAEGMKTYTNEQYGYSLQYPESWDKQLEELSIFTITCLEEEMPVVISAVCDDLSAEDLAMDYNSLMEKSVADMRSQLEEAGMGLVTVTASGPDTVNALPAYKLDMQVKIMDLITMKNSNVIVKNGDSIIVLSLTAEDSVFDKYAPVWEAVKNSLQLTR